ncbi:hypothetical protein GCM10008955_38060 [Deinococcus malanensis]|uniref:Uncharacterized protein n=1 Tax=Deinococcus malanensis TaxID=1706855 RepID=A0ABQ2F208_9DEIO|nr:hypothetical protein [Deinococcus malanensis]GGK40655.1 hypothetical protein GCM10008955_38060 [Deinococcus malanensis]
MTQAPRKRGRPPKSGKTLPPEPAPKEAQPTEATFQPLLPGVRRVVAHRPLSVLEVQDSTDLDMLLLDARVAGQVVSRLGPNFALLVPGSEKAVLDALRKAGHLPKVVGP